MNEKYDHSKELSFWEGVPKKDGKPAHYKNSFTGEECKLSEFSPCLFTINKKEELK